MAIEERARADLALGRHAELCGELERLLADHPYRESLWGLWMLALYRAGRQADALRAFERVRRLLGDELGLEPSSALGISSRRSCCTGRARLGPAARAPRELVDRRGGLGVPLSAQAERRPDRTVRRAACGAGAAPGRAAGRSGGPSSAGGTRRWRAGDRQDDAGRRVRPSRPRAGRRRALRALRRGPGHPVPAVDRAARPTSSITALPACSTSRWRPTAPTWAGSAGARPPRRRSDAATSDPDDSRQLLFEAVAGCPGRRAATSPLARRARRPALGRRAHAAAAAPCRRVGHADGRDDPGTFRDY